MLGQITGVQECDPVGVMDCYKRRITKHTRPKECLLPPWTMPRVRAHLMAAFETIRNALQHPPLSLRNLVLACDHHRNPPPLGTLCSPAHAEHGTPTLITRQDYTKTPTTQPKFIQNKREVPAQRPGRCRTSTRVAASWRGKWCRSTPKQDTYML